MQNEAAFAWDEEKRVLLREVLSTLESSVNEVTLSTLLTMSHQHPGFSFIMRHLREALLNSRLGWLLRMVSRQVQYLSAEEIISLNSRDGPAGAELPDNFLEIFKSLPNVAMNNVLTMLGYEDIMRLQLVGGPFSTHISSARRNFSTNFLLRGRVDLSGVDTVLVVRYHSNITINHQQFSKSLEGVQMRTFLIRHEGELRAASFHIPELTCEKLEIHLANPILPEQEREITQIVEQISANRNIRKLNILARKEENHLEFRQHLESLTERSIYLNSENTNIIVIRP